jgi:hypothetical protein
VEISPLDIGSESHRPHHHVEIAGVFMRAILVLLFAFFEGCLLVRVKDRIYEPNTRNRGVATSSESKYRTCGLVLM